MSTIRLRLRELIAEREAAQGRQLPLEEIARETGIVRQTLEELVHDGAEVLRLRDLAQLCDYLDVKPGMLFDYSSAGQGPLELDARDIVKRWEVEYGSDEHPRG